MLFKLLQHFKFSIVCVEFPGYGIYQNHMSSAQKEKRSQQILKDAETVYKFFRYHFGVEEKDIMISGRSIGSGPACHLAATFKPCCLILISPIKSVTHIAQKMFGKLLSNMLLERGAGR